MREAKKSHMAAEGRRAQCGQRASEVGFSEAEEQGENEAKSHRTLASLLSADQIAVERNIRNSCLKGHTWEKREESSTQSCQMQILGGEISG